MATELIDTHCHLDYDYAPKTAEDLVREAGLAGVSAMVTIGTSMKSLVDLPPIAERFSNVYYTLGVHPHDARDVADEDIPRLDAAVRADRCVAVGEIGLDFHYDHSPRDVQIARFRDQLAVARAVSKPVVIHTRDAEPETLEILKEHVAVQGSVKGGGRPPGVIHCFTGTRDFGIECIRLGFLISFSGIVTFKKADALQDCARAFPLASLMVETDSPYLAPLPFRGKKCEPSMVVHTAMKLAELKGVDLEEVARATSANARRLFELV